MRRKAMKSIDSVCAILAVAALVGCRQTVEPPSPPPEGFVTFPEAKAALERGAERARDKYSSMSFEDFKATVYREPAELGGKFIVNGDTSVLNEKHLQEFFETQVKGNPGLRPTHLTRAHLTVATAGGQDTVWNSAMQRQLTYCVSSTFGTRQAQVIDSMDAAVGAWEVAADIDFIHVDAEDDECDQRNPNVVFDVRPVNVNGRYLARAFFPNEPRASRNVLIDVSSFQLNPGGNLTLTGILRHELGHTLGFRHEHTRPEAGTCFEDNDWRPVTDYDAFSVMHYPQCNGRGDWSLTLTHLDQNGVACLYGAAPGFTVDTAICPEADPAPVPCTVHTQTFSQQSVAKDEEKVYGPFPVAPDTLFEAKMQGEGAAGDPDLYVRFEAGPRLNLYDCRPYLLGADETCSVDVPDGRSQAFVMVHGYSAGRYTLTIVHTPPTP